MVKKLDEKDVLPDHIGWRLWVASREWQRAFVSGLQAAGHDWFTEARAALMGHIPRAGIKQGALLERTGTTKQAVQQILDGLEADGVIARTVDPADRRGKIIRYTDKGLAALKDGDRIKRDIETEYRGRLGSSGFDALMAALRTLHPNP
jgi:DNA-binding MarR family transcriptional regulator